MKRPIKLTWILTEVCHHRCEICRLWESPGRGPNLSAIELFMSANPYFPWINLSGGELLARPDIEDVINVILSHQPRLDWLSFPTAGFLPEKTEALVSSILNHRKSNNFKLAVTVSIDGYRELHDRLRGRDGAYDRATETFDKLRRIENGRFSATLGLTLSRHNVDHVDETLSHLERDLPGWNRRQLHLNIAHHSPHYYQNSPDVRAERAQMESSLTRLQTNGRTTIGQAESLYRRLALDYIRTGKTPLPCRAAEVSVFVGHDMRVFPCSTWDRPLGSLAEFDFDLSALLSSETAQKAREEIAQEQCPGCWTPCDALPTIITQLPRASWRAWNIQQKSAL